MCTECTPRCLTIELAGEAITNAQRVWNWVVKFDINNGIEIFGVRPRLPHFLRHIALETCLLRKGFRIHGAHLDSNLPFANSNVNSIIIASYDSLIAMHYTIEESTLTKNILSGSIYIDAQGIIRLNLPIYYMLFGLMMLLSLGNTFIFAFIFYQYWMLGVKPRKNSFKTVQTWFVVKGLAISVWVFQLDPLSSVPPCFSWGIVLLWWFQCRNRDGMRIWQLSHDNGVSVWVRIDEVTFRIVFAIINQVAITLFF
jgi:hypothetical protein